MCLIIMSCIWFFYLFMYLFAVNKIVSTLTCKSTRWAKKDLSIRNMLLPLLHTQPDLSWGTLILEDLIQIPTLMFYMNKKEDPVCLKDSVLRVNPEDLMHLTVVNLSWFPKCSPLFSTAIGLLIILNPCSWWCFAT